MFVPQNPPSYSIAHLLYKRDISNRTQDLKVIISYLFSCNADQWAVRSLASQVDLIETQRFWLLKTLQMLTIVAKIVAIATIYKHTI
jgi:hypothetical protein